MRLAELFRNGHREVDPDPRFRDFRNFVTVAWAALGYRPPTFGQLSLARTIQEGLDTENQTSLIIEAFRGIGKSVILGCVPPWLLMWDNRLNFMITSAQADKAEQFASYCRRLIRDMPILEHLRPGPEDRAGAKAFDVHGAPNSQTPSLRSVAVFGTYTGGRADCIFGDDLEAPNTSETQGQREKLWARTGEFVDLLKPQAESLHKIVYLGTNHTEDSYYLRLVRERGAKLFIFPARYPSPDLRKYYAESFHPDLADRLDSGGYRDTGSGLWVPIREDDPTDPERFSDADLLLKRTDKGTESEREWNMQYMLDPRVADQERYPLKVRDLMVDDLDAHRAYELYVWSNDPRQRLKEDEVESVAFNGDHFHRPALKEGTLLPYTVKKLFVDPSGKGRDETAWCVLAALNGYYFVLDWGGYLDGFGEDTLRGLTATAKQFQVNGIYIESNFGNGMFAKLLQPVLHREYRCGIEEEHSTGQKELRICDALQPALANHRVVMSLAAIRKDYAKVPAVESHRQAAYRGIYQLTRMTREKGALAHDDRVEVVAMGVNHFVKQAALDAQERLEARSARTGKIVEAFWRTPVPKGKIGLRRSNPGPRKSRYTV